MLVRPSPCSHRAPQLVEYYNLDETGALDPQSSKNYRKFLTQMANQPPFPMDRSEAMDGRGGEAKDAKDEDEGVNEKVNIDHFKLIKVIGKGR